MSSNSLPVDRFWAQRLHFVRNLFRNFPIKFTISILKETVYIYICFPKPKTWCHLSCQKPMCFLIWYSEALDTNVNVNIDTISISVGFGWIWDSHVLHLPPFFPGLYKPWKNHANQHFSWIISRIPKNMTLHFQKKNFPASHLWNNETIKISHETLAVSEKFPRDSKHHGVSAFDAKKKTNRKPTNHLKMISFQGLRWTLGNDWIAGEFLQQPSTRHRKVPFFCLDNGETAVFRGQIDGN